MGTLKERMDNLPREGAPVRNRTHPVIGYQTMMHYAISLIEDPRLRDRTSQELTNLNDMVSAMARIEHYAMKLSSASIGDKMRGEEVTTHEEVTIIRGIGNAIGRKAMDSINRLKMISPNPEGQELMEWFDSIEKGEDSDDK